MNASKALYDERATSFSTKGPNFLFAYFSATVYIYVCGFGLELQSRERNGLMLSLFFSFGVELYMRCAADAFFSRLIYSAMLNTRWKSGEDAWKIFCWLVFFFLLRGRVDCWAFWIFGVRGLVPLFGGIYYSSLFAEFVLEALLIKSYIIWWISY